MTVRIQAADFDVAAESKKLAETSGNVGAIVTFTGLCRDEDGRLAALELEHYPGMAEAAIQSIVDEANARWILDGVTVIHRIGKIEPGANIVLVVTASRHRRAAFEAAEFLMDYLKTRAPFWKKEHVASMSTETGDSGWVSAKEEDDEATARWRDKEKA